ncbi:MAG: 2-C-methyl-D-erythritol 4-phosphate cytidylyltransferase [Bacilli bacterium]|jgi:2-C-methyl-D-erythritol 4-phosphate cytidylyltransferase|nr:2-C-methyl-D-erythritol 4-phosphate cytidylyltransferase [Bacilli bacterium]
MLSAIIVAAGEGERLKQKLGMRKQYFPLKDGKELFLSSLTLFANDPSFSTILLVIPPDDEDKVKSILKREGLEQRVELAFGGKSREESVLNALNYLLVTHANCPEEMRVFIHDADRPFLSKAFLETLKEDSKEEECLVPYLPLTASIYNLQEGRYVPRKDFGLIQTPEVFSLSVLKDAFMNTEDLSLFTDEGSLVAEHGYQVKFIKGEEDNIKISDEKDLDYALWKVSKHE